MSTAVMAREMEADFEPPTYEESNKDLFNQPSTPGNDTIKISKSELATPYSNFDFILGGQQYITMFYATQELDAETNAPVECHACSVKISAITYKQEGDNWKVVSKQKNFATISDWGKVPNVLENPPKFYAISKDVQVVQNNTTSMFQGLETDGAYIFLFADGKWSDGGFIVTGADTTSAELAPVVKWNGKIVFKKGTTKYPDLVVSVKGTENNGDKVAKAKNKTYKFNGSQYAE